MKIHLTDSQYSELSSHKFVGSKVQNSSPHIVSFNFSRDAFLSKNWDSISIKARGLFVNKFSKEIVARSYDKFFNIEEVAATQTRNLKNSLKFPLDIYVKENGFLGIAGYDSDKDELFLTSKSVSDSEFAGYFRDIFNKLDKDTQNKIKLSCKAGYTYVFEVIDPINDPHIISYDKQELILLDIIERTDKFKKLSYPWLQATGLKIKEKAVTINSWSEFKAWYEEVSKQDYMYNGRNIEGFVVEDSSGFHFKIKLGYYSFWKVMRSVKDKIKKDNKQVNTDEAPKDFTAWCKLQEPETLTKDIITLRKMFEGKVVTHKNVKYVALKLNKEDRNIVLREIHPIHHKVYCDHVTLAFDVDEFLIDKISDKIGKSFDIVLDKHFKDDKCQALTVEVPATLRFDINQKHHITLSCQTGTSPKYSNELIKGDGTQTDRQIITGELVVLSARVNLGSD